MWTDTSVLFNAKAYSVSHVPDMLVEELSTKNWNRLKIFVSENQTQENCKFKVKPYTTMDLIKLTTIIKYYALF